MGSEDDANQRVVRDVVICSPPTAWTIFFREGTEAQLKEFMQSSHQTGYKREDIIEGMIRARDESDADIELWPTKWEEKKDKKYPALD